MLLSKNVAGSDKPRKSKFKAVVASLTNLNPVYLFKAKKSPEVKTLEEKFDVVLPENTVVDARYQEVTSLIAPVSKQVSKNLHREDIEKLNETRAANRVKSDLAVLLDNLSELDSELLETRLVPQIIEDMNFGLLIPLTPQESADKFSKMKPLQKINFALGSLSLLIKLNEKISASKNYDHNQFQSGTIRTRYRYHQNQKGDLSEIYSYEALAASLLKQKFILGFNPEVRQIIVDELLPELIEEGFTEAELFALDKEEIKYNLYQVLVELSKDRLIKTRYDKVEIALHALRSSFMPSKKPFGQQ